MSPALLLCLAAAAAPEAKAAAAEPKPAAAPETFVSPATGMKFVRLPAGKFRMGSPADEPGRRTDEGPVHEVTISKPFFLGSCEVTVAEFGKFVADTGYKTRPERDGKGGVGFGRTVAFESHPLRNWRNTGLRRRHDDYPVACIAWGDAVEFCKWLSKKDGRTYRLPTEAEWEYACRAGTTTRYFTGDEPAGLHGHANVADKRGPSRGHGFDDAFDFSDSIIYYAVVGRYKPNPWGLHDMIGNVGEWCADGLRDYPDMPAADPAGTDARVRAVRGASFFSGAETARCATRSFLEPDTATVLIGFRVLLEVPGKP